MANYTMQNGTFLPQMQNSLNEYASNVPFQINGGTEVLRTLPQPSSVMPRFNFPQPNARHMLGALVPPMVGAAAAGAAVGGLIALVKNALDDDWADQQVFTSNARAIHTGMLGIQCIIGGATTGASLIDTLGNTICVGGTKPTCSMPSTMLTEWRVLRDGFSAFWASVADKFSSPNNAEAAQLKSYATQFYNFYLRVSQVCRAQGTLLPTAPLPPELTAQQPTEPAPGWLKWSVGGLGLLVLWAGIRTFSRK